LYSLDGVWSLTPGAAYRGTHCRGRTGGRPRSRGEGPGSSLPARHPSKAAVAAQATLPAFSVREVKEWTEKN
jgi:hypothetical protein